MTAAPFLVKRDGTVLHRATETYLGRVYLSVVDGWVALNVSGDRLPNRYPYGRKWAARAVYEAHGLYERDRQAS